MLRIGVKTSMWNPWHGCHKISAGCEHCYVYRMDERHGKETGVVTRLKDFDKVLHKNRKGEYKIVEDFKDDLIPEGFSKTKAEYDGKQYEAIKGDKKDLTAFYLKKGSTKGFYIYDYETKKFSSLRNIKIASRMYTVVNPSEKASCLKKYTKKQITVIDQEVNAWVLNEEEGLYLLYAMNWNGDTNLYCYDDNEKCFQRYIAEDDVNTQIEAANKAYNNVKNKYNTLVSKYNMLLKIACGLVIVIIILIFVSLTEKKKDLPSRKNMMTKTMAMEKTRKMQKIQQNQMTWKNQMKLNLWKNRLKK